MFLPITKKECKKLGWKKLDIIFVTGDAYIDSPYIGISILGKLLIKEGFRVGVISQPSLDSEKDILSLGVPQFFWAVTAGSIDSMVANYTPLLKKRKSDDYTPGGLNIRRPDRATIRYVNLIKRYDKSKKLILIGGIEASLRRIAHYDYWSNNIRKSILFDSKADVLMYGMSEKTMVEFAHRVKNNEDYKDLRGICYISKYKKNDFVELPSFEDVTENKDKFINMMKIFYNNQDPISGKGIIQKYNDRFLIHNPPQILPTPEELDSYYGLDYEYDVHPLIKEKGEVRALNTIKNSITINRGCFGECNFCAITVHQGSTVVSRTPESIIREIKRFKGYINDFGGPTANMYGYECDKKVKYGKCIDKRCVFPEICKNLKVSHEKLIHLLRKVREINGIKKVFIRSGLRYDLILHDKKYGEKYLEELIKYHISGQLKIAPEHLNDKVLYLMGKPSNEKLKDFIKLFYGLNKKFNKKQFLTYYFIVSHPGCTLKMTKKLKNNISKILKAVPEQVQIYTPLPLTWSSVMYYTERNPFTGEKIQVVKDLKIKRLQKEILVRKPR